MPGAGHRQDWGTGSRDSTPPGAGQVLKPARVARGDRGSAALGAGAGRGEPRTPCASCPGRVRAGRGVRLGRRGADSRAGRVPVARATVPPPSPRVLLLLTSSARSRAARRCVTLRHAPPAAGSRGHLLVHVIRARGAQGRQGAWQRAGARSTFPTVRGTDCLAVL